MANNPEANRKRLVLSAIVIILPPFPIVRIKHKQRMSCDESPADHAQFKLSRMSQYFPCLFASFCTYEVLEDAYELLSQRRLASGSAPQGWMLRKDALADKVGSKERTRNFS